MEEKYISGEESLHLISSMIEKVKATIHERGTSAILWGAVIALAGFISFSEKYFHFTLGFDVWLLTWLAFIPQVYISISEKKRRTVLTYNQRAINAVWIVYSLSIVCYIFYLNVVPAIAQKFFMQENSGVNVQEFPFYIYSAASVLLILFAIPTLTTGIIAKFTPMVIGGCLSYVMFFISCFTPSLWDMFLLGIAGIINWLIPGLLLRKRYLKSIAADV